MVIRHPLIYWDTVTWSATLNDKEQYLKVKESAAVGDFRFKAVLALFLYRGIGCEKDEERSYDLIWQIYNSNDADAICLLGEWYEVGYFGGVNKRIAWRSYQEVVKICRYKGMYMLGNFYYALYKERGSKKYIYAAKKCFLNAYKCGHIVSLITCCVIDNDRLFGRVACLASSYVKNIIPFSIISFSEKWWRYRDYLESWPKLVRIIDRKFKIRLGNSSASRGSE